VLLRNCWLPVDGLVLVAGFAMSQAAGGRNKPESPLPYSARSLIEVLGVEATAFVPRLEGDANVPPAALQRKRWQGSPGGVRVALNWSVGADRVPVVFRLAT
jgi:hypothetical protein